MFLCTWCFLLGVLDVLLAVQPALANRPPIREITFSVYKDGKPVRALVCSSGKYERWTFNLSVETPLKDFNNCNVVPSRSTRQFWEHPSTFAVLYPIAEEGAENPALPSSEVYYLPAGSELLKAYYAFVRIDLQQAPRASILVSGVPWYYTLSMLATGLLITLIIEASVALLISGKGSRLAVAKSISIANCLTFPMLWLLAGPFAGLYGGSIFIISILEIAIIFSEFYFLVHRHSLAYGEDVSGLRLALVAIVGNLASIAAAFYPLMEVGEMFLKTGL